MTEIPKHKESFEFHVLIASAGKGQRFGSEIPKQYLDIHGKSSLRYCLELFSALPECRSITVIADAQDAKLYHDASKDLCNITFVEGDESRKESVYNGLLSLSNIKDQDIVLIHDAARPCLKQKHIYALMDALQDHEAATLAVKASDTFRRSQEDCIASDVVDREDLWHIQTPQAFRYGTIMKAHNELRDDASFTDDTSMLQKIGVDTKLVEGSRTNIKITTKEDLELAKNFLSPQNHETRTGQGFDVHAFETKDKDRKLVLGGIEINHTYGLKGHSDADVALHAITDALLGAIGQGDIGDHFPPSDTTYKDMDSRIFLEKAHDILKGFSGSIVNVDLTIICEAPKIGPHKLQIQNKIADILKIDQTRVNVKATTTEELGFTGRKEGIAAQAIVNVKLPL